MKCVFPLETGEARFLRLTEVMVRSARKHTELDLYCLNGGIPLDFRRWLEQQGVTVCDWRLSFRDELETRYDGSKPLTHPRGAYLRVDLPEALRRYGVEDEYVVYVDVDIIFLRPIELHHLRPQLFATPPDWDMQDRSRFNTGVMLLNVDGMREVTPGLLDHLRKHRFNFEFVGLGPCDQGAYNHYFGAQAHDWLEPEYEWKPWWGPNEDARIVHFAGPKPWDIRRVLAQGEGHPATPKDYIPHQVFHRSPEGYRHYLDTWYAFARAKDSHRQEAP